MKETDESDVTLTEEACRATLLARAEQSLGTLIDNTETTDHPPDEGAADLPYLAHDWALQARAKQCPPDGAWRIWLLLAGRGFGKTRTGAEWLSYLARHCLICLSPLSGPPLMMPAM